MSLIFPVMDNHIGYKYFLAEQMNSLLEGVRGIGPVRRKILHSVFLLAFEEGENTDKRIGALHDLLNIYNTNRLHLADCLLQVIDLHKISSILRYSYSNINIQLRTSLKILSQKESLLEEKNGSGEIINISKKCTQELQEILESVVGLIFLKKVFKDFNLSIIKDHFTEETENKFNLIKCLDSLSDLFFSEDAFVKVKAGNLLLDLIDLNLSENRLTENSLKQIVNFFGENLEELYKLFGSKIHVILHTLTTSNYQELIKLYTTTNELRLKENIFLILTERSFKLYEDNLHFREFIENEICSLVNTECDDDISLNYKEFILDAILNEGVPQKLRLNLINNLFGNYKDIVDFALSFPIDYALKKTERITWLEKLLDIEEYIGFDDSTNWYSYSFRWVLKNTITARNHLNKGVDIEEASRRFGIRFFSQYSTEELREMLVPLKPQETLVIRLLSVKDNSKAQLREFSTYDSLRKELKQVNARFLTFELSEDKDSLLRMIQDLGILPTNFTAYLILDGHGRDGDNHLIMNGYKNDFYRLYGNDIKNLIALLNMNSKSKVFVNVCGGVGENSLARDISFYPIQVFTTSQNYVVFNDKKLKLNNKGEWEIVFDINDAIGQLFYSRYYDGRLE